ncbi:MAG: zinc ribbon domain-containing protein [Lachnospiraceae bacterium]|nr:zinc ribbon domain-containing protein [Lachnospiraceae bacterium]
MDNFCKNCGTQIKKKSLFCSSCGADLNRGVKSTEAYVKNSKIKPNKIVWRVFLIILSTMLIFIGAGYAALAIMGKTSNAKVIGIEQVAFLANDSSTRNPARYKLSYEFVANGNRYTGSVTRVFEGGSQMKSSVPVLYLSFWPHINTEDRGYGTLISLSIILLGAFILFRSLRNRK